MLGIVKLARIASTHRNSFPTMRRSEWCEAQAKG